MISDAERKAKLADHVSQILATGGGWRVESQRDFDALLIRGHWPNHTLHLLLSVFTLGLWLLIWLIVAMASGEHRYRAYVDEYGNARTEKLS